jgi:hypothetical protein
VVVFFSVVSERELFVFCDREKRENFTMPPRRERQLPNPEDRDVRRRGRQAQVLEMERQIRDLRVRLENMEVVQRHTTSARDLSDSEGEVEAEQ